MKKYLLVLSVLLASILMIAVQQCKHYRAEADRLTANVESLSAGTEQFKTEAGKQAARAQQLELTTGELKKQCTDLQARLEDMGVKSKYLHRATSTTTKTVLKVDTLVRDSIIYVERLAQLDTVQVLKWSDEWVRLYGTIYKGRFAGTITSIDTITVAVHRVPKQWLFFRWGTKRVDVSVSSSNPHTEIMQVQCVEIKK